MHSIEFVVLNTLQQTSGYREKRRLQEEWNEGEEEGREAGPQEEGVQWIAPPLSFPKQIGQPAEAVQILRLASAELATPTPGVGQR